MNERLDILRKTKAAKTQPGAKKLAADAWVQSHGVGDFLDVCPDFFAEIGNDVGVADFQRQKGIGSVLDQLGAADGGDQKLGGMSRRAGAIVDRAVEGALENWPVDLAHIPCGGVVFHADHDAVRMPEIFNGGALAKELRIGDDPESDIAVARVGGESAAQLQ